MNKTCTTLINCTILTMDEADTFFPDGVIVIENDQIVEIGAAGEICPRGKTVDLQGGLVMPGLINTHTHSHSSLFKNTADDLSLMDWLKTAMWPMEKHLSAERAYAATQMSCLEYIQSGITCYADQFYFANTVAQAAQASGLRCFLAATVFTDPSPETTDTLCAATDFIERWHGKQDETLIYPCIGPHAPYSVSAPLWKACVALSEKYNLILHTHISETKDENMQIQEKTGMSPTAWLHSLGVLERPVLAAHSIHLNEADMELYCRCAVHISHNPVSNLKLVSGIMPMKQLLEKGISISLGTDGAQSNNSMDLLRDLRTAVLLQKQVNEDATFLNARDALRMVTVEGARALRMEEEVGSLVPGKKADLIVLDTDSPRLCPCHKTSLKNLYATVTYSACGADVRDSMVNGKWLMQNRRVLTLAVTEVRKNAMEASGYLIKHSGIEM